MCLPFLLRTTARGSSYGTTPRIHLARRGGFLFLAVALRMVICQAQGILLERYRIDAQQSFSWKKTTGTVPAFS
jgi:hypothetical protein